jgi:hypothetical protein
MTHVFFALFPRRDPAAHALRELRQAKRRYPRAPMQLALHHGHVDREELPLSSTNGRRRLYFGIYSGLFWGAVVGVILHLSGLARAGFGMAVGFTALTGMLIGALGGVLTGVSSPDDALEHLTTDLHAPEVAVSFATSDDELFEQAHEIFIENGARIEQRTAL